LWIRSLLLSGLFCLQLAGLYSDDRPVFSDDQTYQVQGMQLNQLVMESKKLESDLITAKAALVELKTSFDKYKKIMQAEKLAPKIALSLVSGVAGGAIGYSLDNEHGILIGAVLGIGVGVGLSISLK
jgi:hypothetical protein